MLEKVVVEKCWRTDLEKRIGEVWDKCVVEECCKEVLEKNFVEHCWIRVL